MMLEVHGLVEVDHVVDERRELGRQRAGLPSDALHLLAAGGPLDVASSGTQPSLDALQIARRCAEAPPELLGADPAMILWGGGCAPRGAASSGPRGDSRWSALEAGPVRSRPRWRRSSTM